MRYPRLYLPHIVKSNLVLYTCTVLRPAGSCAAIIYFCVSSENTFSSTLHLTRIRHVSVVSVVHVLSPTLASVMAAPSQNFPEAELTSPSGTYAYHGHVLSCAAWCPSVGYPLPPGLRDVRSCCAVSLESCHSHTSLPDFPQLEQSIPRTCGKTVVRCPSSSSLPGPQHLPWTNNMAEERIKSTRVKISSLLQMTQL